MHGRKNGTPVTVDFLIPHEGQCIQLDLTGQERLILNPGSVGQPRDNDPRAAYGRCWIWMPSPGNSAGSPTRSI